MEHIVRSPVDFILNADVAHIVLARPENRNALSVEMIQGIRDAIRSAEASPARAVVLRADGPAFCAGMDLSERDPERMEKALATLVEVMRSILASPLPFIARVHGPARAGGLGLVCAADFAIAADHIDIAFPEARLGLAPTVVSLTVLPRLEAGTARRLFLLGERLSAAEALEVGLLDDVVVAESLDDAIGDVLDALSLAKAEGLAASKALVNAATVSQLDRTGADLVSASTAMFTARAESDRRG